MHSLQRVKNTANIYFRKLSTVFQRRRVQNCLELIRLTTSVPDVWTERRRRICTHASGVLKALSLHRLIIKIDK